MRLASHTTPQPPKDQWYRSPNSLAPDLGREPSPLGLESVRRNIYSVIQIGVAISYPLGRAAARMGENACCGAGIADGPSGASWVPSSASSLEQLSPLGGD